MKIVDKKQNSHVITLEGHLEIVNGDLCLVEFDGEGEIVRTCSIAEKLDKQGFVGTQVKIKVEEPTEKEEIELSLD